MQLHSRENVVWEGSHRAKAALHQGSREQCPAAEAAEATPCGFAHSSILQPFLLSS